jgi:membrane associated rhomboid family serine protease
LIPFSDASVRHRTFPYVNSALIAISIIVFLYEMTLGGFGALFGGGGLDLDIFFFKWGFIAQELSAGEAFETLNTGFSRVDIETPVPTVFTIFTSMFIHGGFMHLAGNMGFLCLETLDIRSRNMNQVFRESLAWRKLIVPAEGRGMYRLNITLR